MSAAMSENTAPFSRNIIPAMTTPLASVFGSGFLLIVPVLVGAVGPWAVAAMVGIAFVAFHTGAIIRHNILCAEPILAKGEKRSTLLIERLSDVALIIAYVVAICLYVHVLSAFALGPFELDSPFNKSLLTSLVIASISIVGITGGLKPLQRVESWALYITLAILAVLLASFAVYDLDLSMGTEGLTFPPLPARSNWEMMTIVAGALIVVQGFETPRYLGAEFSTSTRIRASRWAQYLSLSAYVVFVALALPVTPALNGRYADNSLIQLATTVSGLLTLPLVGAAILSQFSAAVADLIAAAANLEEVSRKRVRPQWGYLLVGSAAVMLAWSGSTFEIIALASRAFALYYLLQCLVGFTVCRNHFERARFILVGIALLFVLVFAAPIG